MYVEEFTRDRSLDDHQVAYMRYELVLRFYILGHDTV